MILAGNLTTHPEALKYRVALERVLVQRLAKLRLLAGKGLDNPVDFRWRQRTVAVASNPWAEPR